MLFWMIAFSAFQEGPIRASADESESQIVDLSPDRCIPALTVTETPSCEGTP
jgi:hypothetical protein